jgi:DNA-binding HxlR family transcriptional regulator
MKYPHILKIYFMLFKSDFESKGIKIKSKLLPLLVIFLVTQNLLAGRQANSFPEFEFDVWGRPPSRKVYELTREKVVQNILFSIKENAVSAGEIAKMVGKQESIVTEKLDQLKQFGLVKQVNQKWISNIPLYTKAEMEEAEKIGMKYVKKQAAILRREIPDLKQLYNNTALSKNFSWDEVSLIVVGAFLSDFCVVDRIPFRPENFTMELQPALKTGDLRWGYDGFEKLPKRFSSRKWKFYQNVVSKSSGGMSRFGYFKENRTTPPSRPEHLFLIREGKILSALADGPLSLAELEKQTEFDRTDLTKTLNEMSGYNPPAVVLSDGKYRSAIPVLNESDFVRLLAECDRIAEEIFTNVVLPNTEERKIRAKELGYRWPLPADTYVRDKTIQILIEEGLLSGVQSAPVDWNFCLWGWKGFLRMHNQITDDLQPDPFLKTPISEAEKKRIGEFNTLKSSLLQGYRHENTSTPANALITRISALVNSDIEALKMVFAPSNHINQNYIESPNTKKWAEYMKTIKIKRVPPAPKEPKDGDVSPVFTIDNDGFEQAFVFFYYKGGWKTLFNTPREGLWQTAAQDILSEKLKSLGL